MKLRLKIKATRALVRKTVKLFYANILAVCDTMLQTGKNTVSAIASSKAWLMYTESEHDPSSSETGQLKIAEAECLKLFTANRPALTDKVNEMHVPCARALVLDSTDVLFLVTNLQTERFSSSRRLLK